MNALRLIAVLGLAAGLTACHSPRSNKQTEPAEAEYNLVMAKGRQALERGRIETADTYYRRALRLARAGDDRARGRMAAYHLGLVEALAGAPGEAAALFDEALLNADTAEEAVPLLAAAAEVARMQGRPDTARRYIEEARGWMAAAEDRMPPAQSAQFLLLEGAQACDAGAITPARAALDAAEAVYPKWEDPLLLATRLRLTGRILRLEDQPGKAALQFDEEAETRRRHHQLSAMAEALDLAGSAWLSAGEAEPAADRWYRSALAWDALGREEHSLQALGQALEAAAHTSNERLQRRLAEWAEKFEKNE